jgi:hypothetical protein
MQAKAVSRLLGLTLCLALLYGCGQLPQRAERPSTDPMAERAATLLAQGEYLAAAALYGQLASATSDPATRSRYLLAAAEAAAQGGDWDTVRAIVAELGTMPLGQTENLRYRLMLAEVYLQERRPLDAIDALGPAPPQDTPRELQIRYFKDLAGTYRQMGNLLESANALQQLDALLTGGDARLSNQTDILRTLVLLNEQVLEQLQPSPPGVAGGWMQLALIVRQHGRDPGQLDPLLDAWRARFPGHPAMPELLDTYAARLQGQLTRFDRIAVLLPQSGNLAAVSTAIRNGMLIRHLDPAAAPGPTLRFYDTTDPASVWPRYNEAVADGAELVIGPLQKEAVDQLLRAGSLPVPVLALNEVALSTAPPDNLFMFSLSPEDEARQVAEKAWLDGIRRPAVLVPQGDWGDRIAAAYQSRWQTLGGDLAGTSRYDATTHDYSDAIRSLLHLDRSEARHQEMQRWLGKRLEFEPRRRADVDAVFIAARPVQAQGIRPQLQFHRAADLPVYATSHAWLGQLSSRQTEDMRGILLPDIPWLLTDPGTGLGRDEVVRNLPNSGSAFARLYAMGMDALTLAPHLDRLRSSRFEALDGATGNLYMDEQQRVRRQLVWIRLDEPPEILGFAPRLDLQEGPVELAPVESPTDGSAPAS